MLAARCSFPYRKPVPSTRFPSALQFLNQLLRESLNSLSLKLFGAPQVLRNGVSLHGKATQRRRLALLALLATAPSRALSRDRLIGLIWAERDATQARKLLSESLYVIRRELGEQVLDTSAGDLVTLNADALDCDIWAFSAAIAQGDLETAASISDAPFMDGVFLDEAEEFERWLDGERRRIATERERALEQLAESAELDGRWLDAARSWERLLHDDPLSSRRVLGAAGALASGGEVPAALQLLSAFESRLRRELDVAPEPDVLELGRRLRAERPPTAATSGPRSRIASPAAPIGTVQEVFSTAATRAASHALINTPPAPLAIVAARPTAARRFWFALVPLVAVLALVGWWTVRPEAPTELDPRRLVVPYFHDGSPQGDLGSVADLITEAVIEQLAGSPAFEVIPVSGVRRLRDEQIGADSVARRFGAGTVIHGAVYRRGENILVRVQLVDATSGAIVASSSLERGLHELFALEQDVARELAIGIRQRLGQEVRLTELERESSNVRAYQLVARGNRERDEASVHSARGGAEESSAALSALRRADSLYRQARIEDPAWVRPIVEQAWTALSAAVLVDGAERVHTLERAIARLDSAPARQRSNPALLEARSALRWSRLKMLPPPLDTAALASIIYDLERALDADPERARSWSTLSNIYWFRNDTERGEMFGRRALAADAYIEDAPAIYRTLFAVSIYQNQMDSASTWCARGRREYPDSWWFRECELTVMKYDVASPPDPQRAWRIVQETDSLDPPELAAMAGHRYAPVYRRLVAAAISARAGDEPRARQELERQRTAAAEDSTLALDMTVDEVTLLLQFGEREQAVARMRWLIERRPFIESLIGRDPILRTIARDVVPADASSAGTAVPIRRP